MPGARPRSGRSGAYGSLGYHVKRLDPLSPAERSTRMGRVRSTNTAPEIAVRRVLTELGCRYRLHDRRLEGRPDIVLGRYKKAIFVHGCFWHRHRGCSRTRVPRTRVDFWKKKFDANIERDRVVRRSLRAAGWSLLVIWECQTEKRVVLLRLVDRFLGRRP
jgi:DNA mismatch endonuclease (patch repair protein)